MYEITCYLAATRPPDAWLRNQASPSYARNSGFSQPRGCIGCAGPTDSTTPNACTGRFRSTPPANPLLTNPSALSSSASALGSRSCTSEAQCTSTRRVGGSQRNVLRPFEFGQANVTSMWCPKQGYRLQISVVEMQSRPFRVAPHTSCL